MDTTKIQWSKFSPDRSEQYVIRVDTWEELVELKKNVEGVVPTEAFPNDIGKPQATPISQAQTPVPMCGIHGTPMTLKPAGVSKAGRAYPAFYSCGQKNADQTFCKFRPE